MYRLFRGIEHRGGFDLMSLFELITNLLDGAHVGYVVKHHPPTLTSEDSARERREPLKIGAKALLLKDDTHFVLLVLPADRRIDVKKVKTVLQSKNLRFATPEELKEVTSCEKGAVPPFGKLLGVDMIVDGAQFEEEWMAFNAGSLEISIKMKSVDYRKVVRPKVEGISASS